MIDCSKRHCITEQMDDPQASRTALFQAFYELEVINELLGGHKTSIRGVQTLIKHSPKTLSILDVGCGGGDTAKALIDWGDKHNIHIDVVGIDLLDDAVLYAQNQHYDERIQYRKASLFELEHETFDIVHIAMALHHFPNGQAIHAIQTMHKISRLGVVINDIHRNPFAYYSIGMLTRLFSKSGMVKHDAPTSVLNAFSKQELVELCQHAGVPSPSIHWDWAFRWRMVIPS